MKKCCFVPAVLIILWSSCFRKTDKDRAIALVESQYNSSKQKMNFENARLDSLYNITPKAFADSLKRGRDLDAILASLETQIENYEQRESDSVGLISAQLTQERYNLLERVETKPRFLGWTLSGVKIDNVKSEVLSFNFDREITKIVP